MLSAAAPVACSPATAPCCPVPTTLLPCPHRRALLLNLVLPCGLAYCMELSARRAFCRSVLSPQ